ncbi:MAG TPA: DUF4412 domain-containing protein [Bacteroidota bacterium]|nr:DUF4412 domain-containing protein [Bacteroidota bacterium]
MKKYMLLFCFFLFVGVLHAQFEGQIDMKMSGHNSGKETQLVLLMKGDLMAFSTKGDGEMEKGGDVIFRPDKNVMWILSPHEKSYLEIVPDKEMLSSHGKVKDKLKKNLEKQLNRSGFKKTGNTQTIAGYECDEWVSDEDGEVARVWGTSKLGNVYEGFLKAMGQWGASKEARDNQGWQNELIDKRIFPMKTVVTENGTVAESQEVTKVEKKSLSASLFEPPPGYKKQAMDMDLGKMMKGLREGKGENARAISKEDLEKLMKQFKQDTKDTKAEHDSTDKDDDDDDDDE